MKPEIINYSLGKTNYIAIIKKGLIIDIACSKKGAGMYSEILPLSSVDLFNLKTHPLLGDLVITEVKARDLALYTHWPIHTKEFWDLLNEI